ncbi:MAG: polyprenyl synthetase family protein [Candidatus Asgardarchaeia archaeon]
MDTDILVKFTEKAKVVDPVMLELLKIGASDDFFEVLRYQVEAGGKRIRPGLCLTFCEAVGGSREDAIYPAAGIELVHNYSLIIDDIIDNSTLRRGKPTVWKKFSMPMALLAALHYREAIEEAIRRSKKPIEMSKLFSDSIREMTEGERLDILFEQAGREHEYILKKRFKAVSEKDYEFMVRCKTSSLLKCACVSGALSGTDDEGLIKVAEEYGIKIGIAFQIVDDYLDLFAKSEKFGKEIAKDIKEHKLGNIIVIYALSSLDEEKSKKFLGILGKDKLSEEEVSEAMDLIKETDAAEVALKRANSLVDEAKAILRNLPKKDARKELEAIADIIVRRTY